MDPSEYQTFVKSTLKHSHCQKYRATFLGPVLELAAETGEVVELYQKAVRNNTYPEDYRIAEELGDVLWAVAAIACSRGMSFSGLMDMNKRKLTERMAAAAAAGESSQKPCGTVEDPCDCHG